MNSSQLKFTASISGGIAVVAGAFGAHYLSEQLSKNDRKSSWTTGVSYQLIHSVAVIAVANDPTMRKAATAWLAGSALFSGSIYLLCLDAGPRALLGPTTPLGGTVMIAGWVMAAVAALK